MNSMKQHAPIWNGVKADYPAWLWEAVPFLDSMGLKKYRQGSTAAAAAARWTTCLPCRHPIRHRGPVAPEGVHLVSVDPMRGLVRRRYRAAVCVTLFATFMKVALRILFAWKRRLTRSAQRVCRDATVGT